MSEGGVEIGQPVEEQLPQSIAQQVEERLVGAIGNPSRREKVVNEWRVFTRAVVNRIGLETAVKKTVEGLVERGELPNHFPLSWVEKGENGGVERINLVQLTDFLPILRQFGIVPPEVDSFPPSKATQFLVGLLESRGAEKENAEIHLLEGLSERGKIYTVGTNIPGVQMDIGVQDRVLAGRSPTDDFGIPLVSMRLNLSQDALLKLGGGAE